MSQSSFGSSAWVWRFVLGLAIASTVSSGGSIAGLAQRTQAAEPSPTPSAQASPTGGSAAEPTPTSSPTSDPGLTPTIGGSPSPIEQVFAIGNHPNQLRLSDLDEHWKMFTLTSQFEASVALSFTSNIFGVGASNYYTKGDLITWGDKSFLLAYRLSPGTPQKAGDVSGSLVLYPSLINLTMAGSINDLQPFNLTAELTRLKQRFNQQPGFPFGPFPGMPPGSPSRP